jgi:hypothetical protein
MKQSTIFILLILLYSCAKPQEKENKIITKFENSLGKLETKYLNEMVDDFDTFLAKKYDNNSTSNLKIYLKELSSTDKQEIWKIENKKLKQYLSSNLFAKYDTIYPDSVWIEDNLINVRFKEFETVQSIIPIDNNDIKALVEEIKKEPELNQTVPSSFYQALKIVANQDSLIANYLDYWEIAGRAPLYLLAGGLSHDYRDDSEYFLKRILIMEMND